MIYGLLIRPLQWWDVFWSPKISRSACVQTILGRSTNVQILHTGLLKKYMGSHKSKWKVPVYTSPRALLLLNRHLRGTDEILRETHNVIKMHNGKAKCSKITCDKCLLRAMEYISAVATFLCIQWVLVLTNLSDYVLTGNLHKLKDYDKIKTKNP